MKLFLTPEVLLLAWALILLLIECFAPKMKLKRFAELAMFGVMMILFSTLIFPPYKAPLWENLYIADGLAIFFKRFFLVTLFFILWMSREFHFESEEGRKEFFILPLLTAVGMLLLVSAADFITLFVALELITISFYILVAYQKKSAVALEAGVKYLIIGALSTAFFVYGIAFLIGAVGATRFSVVMSRLASIDSTHLGILFAMALIAVGLAFKVAAVPFHSWAPDVYQGAPTSVTAFLSVGSKAAGFVVLMRIFCVSAFGTPAWAIPSGKLLGVLALLSVILGSFGAIPQFNLKRLLGYSSIANAGFILMALSCLSDRGNHAVFFYLSTYMIAVLLAFFIISLVENKLGDDILDYAGLSKSSPLLAFGLLVALVSLAGIPPLAGFFAKLSVFAAVWEAGKYWLFGVGLLGALVGLYYYLNVVRAMYWLEAPQKISIDVSLSSKLLILLLIFATIILGVWPEPLLRMIDQVLIPLHQGGTVLY